MPESTYTDLLRVRCTDEQKTAYVGAAGGERNLSAWIRESLDAAAAIPVEGLFEAMGLGETPVVPSIRRPPETARGYEEALNVKTPKGLREMTIVEDAPISPHRHKYEAVKNAVVSGTKKCACGAVKIG